MDKNTAVIDGRVDQLGDRHNMVYAGTVVTYGRGLAVITETGGRTELGRIAEMIRSADPGRTPLQQKLDGTGRRIAFAALALAGVVFSMGLWRGIDPKRLFLTAISLAVAAVPEGLPAVVTISLALGSQRMLKRNVLVRRLSAVETLGSVTTICTDKTGTLTENRMAATVAALACRELDLRGTINRDDHLSLLLAAGALCSDAMEGPNGDWTGDPTEIALVRATKELGLEKRGLDRQFPRVSELPFDAERKRMTTVHRLSAQEGGPQIELLPADIRPTPYIAFTKGAVDGMISICALIWTGREARALTPSDVAEILAGQDRLASRGMRVIGIAFRLLPTFDGKDALEQELTFTGMVGLIDPPRAEARPAVERCRTAGIRPIMITVSVRGNQGIRCGWRTSGQG